MNKPFSQACENNKEPIRQVLGPYLEHGGRLLEVGSGTGQHGAYICQYYPDLVWQTSDQAINLDGIKAWVTESGLDNFKLPLELDINSAQWQSDQIDFLYSANTVHIMSWQEVEKFFEFIPSALRKGGYFFLYGPFNYGGNFTSESNAGFDLWLKEQAPHRGIRDFEAINDLAGKAGLEPIADNAMPANNRLLAWKLVNK